MLTFGRAYSSLSLDESGLLVSGWVNSDFAVLKFGTAYSRFSLDESGLLVLGRADSDFVLLKFRHSVFVFSVFCFVTGGLIQILLCLIVHCLFEFYWVGQWGSYCAKFWHCLFAISLALSRGF